MKKYLLGILGVVAIAVVAIGILYRQSIWAAWIAFGPQKGDISKLIEQNNTASSSVVSNQTTTTTAAVNNTAFPLHLPPGFTIEVLAKNIPGARVLKQDNFGNILVSAPKQGKIWLVPATEGKESKPQTLISGLSNPHGLELRCPGVSDGEEVPECELYVAELNKVSLYRYNSSSGSAKLEKKIMDLPSGGRHTTRTLLFSPADLNKLLVSVGSTCDTCYEKDVRNATVLAVDITTGKSEIFAKGLRNAVFMATDLVLGRVMATEMGRDFLGDDIPPDEINILEAGKHYGWPLCYGKNIHDTKFDAAEKNPCSPEKYTPSFIDLPAHSAPLGLAFVPEEGWPEEYWHDILVSYHGSWNRSIPTGYKIVRLRMNDQGEYQGSEDFITGWFDGNGALGRPADLLVRPGGIMFTSDDKAGLVYKITYHNF